MHVDLSVSFPTLSVAEDVKPYQVNGVNPTYPESRYTSDYFISKFTFHCCFLILLITVMRTLERIPVPVELRLHHGNSKENNSFLNVDYLLFILFFPQSTTLQPIYIFYLPASSYLLESLSDIISIKVTEKLHPAP